MVPAASDQIRHSAVASSRRRTIGPYTVTVAELAERLRLNQQNLRNWI